jgi:hypothetical protein
VLTRAPRRVTALLLGAVAAPLVLTTALAGPASASHSCAWQVIENAYVRENPDNDSVVRKTKYAGERVEGPCHPEATPIGGGSPWTPVYCTCATDGIGYIIDRKLRYIGPI